jgi:hypothetical protein
MIDVEQRTILFIHGTVTLAAAPFQKERYLFASTVGIATKIARP